MSVKNNEQKQSARDRLLNAAALLFYKDGIAATGIEAIIKEAGVAKKSLYNNFSSKAELVDTYITERHQEWLMLYSRRSELTSNPVQSILSVFDAYADHAEMAYAHGFRGCGILNAAAELPTDNAGRQAVRLHKEEVETIIKNHLSDLDRHTTAEINLLARHLSFLLEGSIMRAGLEGNSDCVMQAKAIAADLLGPSE
ncbi:TetR/AcrR family transcriptional regulator [Brucellaceae bacterium C25G]